MHFNYNVESNLLSSERCKLFNKMQHKTLDGIEHTEKKKSNRIYHRNFSTMEIAYQDLEFRKWLYKMHAMLVTFWCLFWL